MGEWGNENDGDAPNRSDKPQRFPFPHSLIPPFPSQAAPCQAFLLMSHHRIPAKSTITAPPIAANSHSVV
jgi:hypothetical protein